MDFACWYIGTHPKEKPSKISNTTFAILPFYQKKKKQNKTKQNKKQNATTEYRAIWHIQDAAHQISQLI